MLCSLLTSNFNQALGKFQQIKNEIYVKTHLVKKNHITLVGIYLFKVNNRNTRKRCEIRSKLTIKTPERRQ